MISFAKRRRSSSLVTWALPEPAYLEAVAQNMRASDREECRLMGLSNPLEALQSSVAMSDVAFAGLFGGIPVCIFGGRNGAAGNPRCGVFWELGSDWIETHWRTFIRECRSGVNLMWDALDIDRAENLVWAGNEASIRWLSWLGASFDTEQVAGMEGSRFLRFTLEKE